MPHTQNHSEPSTKAHNSNNDYPIIVHCHLCWDWVWQRPQQFLSRLSRKHRVLFVEVLAPDPALSAPVARFRSPAPFPNLTVLTMQFPASRWNDGPYVDKERRRLVRDFLGGPGAGQFEKPLQWFYDPMAVTAFAGRMNESLVVYDCMDELSKFRGAPPELIQREAELLKQADVVFTGGRKLFEAKSRFHDNCHFYGCGVEAEHFGKARAAATLVPQELSKLSRPVLGFFGVVDERMDYELVARLAQANPNWSIAIVGPVVKVDPQTLPQRPNLHWFGHRSYADLPSLCKGFDVCLMPFALNEATEFINPTKALEYMATGRPIVSTAVEDVVRNFGSVVKVARNGDEFIEHCRAVLQTADPAAIARGFRMVEQNSWDAIVKSMEEHVWEGLAQRATVRSSRQRRPGRLQRGKWKTSLQAQLVAKTKKLVTEGMEGFSGVAL
jgi:glycosyltransferase involved in cell wall biosynthesis